MQKISEFTIIDQRFQRSKRLDQDYGYGNATAIDSYVPQRSAMNILEMMAKNVLLSNQRAFTWTGPYGSGKSSLALLLCSLVGGGVARKTAVKRLQLKADDPIAQAFCTNTAWKVFTLTGRQSRMMDDVASLFHANESTSPTVLAALKKIARRTPADGGVLLIIDELGKYLEADCASENAYLLQELAEIANRSETRVLVVGILHQAVDVYASRMPHGIREEWEKVKGRFVDMPLLGSSDEVVELLGRALQTKNRPQNPAFDRAVKVVAGEYSSNKVDRTGRMHQLLQACWPLNPVTALLLGPIARRKFSQNERSVYSFLSSREPFGFSEFALSHDVSSLYSPSDYWDYLYANFETSILTTADGHRWMTALDAIERAERKGSTQHVQLAKSLALIDLFRAGSGIEASLPILAQSILQTEAKTKTLLKDLLDWKIAISRHHINAYAIFAGSDFNIDEAVADAISKQNGIDTRLMEDLLSLPPIVARSFYMRLGTLRWFDRVIVPEENLLQWLEQKRVDEGFSDAFLLILPKNATHEKPTEVLARLQPLLKMRIAEDYSLIMGVSEESALIRSQLEELQALSVVAKNPQLEGDETGRKEVAARIAQTRDYLIGSLRGAFTHAYWQEVGSTRVIAATRMRDLNVLASNVAENVYPSVPEIRNELINRDYLSTNIVTARKQLMYRMLLNETEKDLGYTGFPPDYALYLSMLSEIRRLDANELWRFDTSLESDKYDKFWELTDRFLNSRAMTTVKDLYAFWRKAPIGLRFGPMPILALAFYLANRERIALYQNTTFTPSITTAVIDEWLNDPARIALRPVTNTGKNQVFVDGLAKLLPKYSKVFCDKTPLEVARLIVRIFLESPKWAQHSTMFSANTQAFKQTVLKASDPVKLLFHDLPKIYGTEEPDQLLSCVDASLKEYLEAMPKMIEKTKRLLFDALKADPMDLEDIHQRALSIKGISGQMQIEAFIARLEKFKNTRFDIEGFIGLACSRPSFQWTDNDIRLAQAKLVEFAFEFRQFEAMGAMLGRNTKRRVFALVLGGASADIKETVELSDGDENRARMVSKQIRAMLSEVDRTVAIAALAEAGFSIIKNSEKS